MTNILPDYKKLLKLIRETCDPHEFMAWIQEQMVLSFDSLALKQQYFHEINDLLTQFFANYTSHYMRANQQEEQQEPIQLLIKKLLVFDEYIFNLLEI